MRQEVDQGWRDPALVDQFEAFIRTRRAADTDLDLELVSRPAERPQPAKQRYA